LLLARQPLGLASTSEDAFFWHSKRGYHLLTHSWRTCGQPLPSRPGKPNPAAGSCGAYSWSEDGTVRKCNTKKSQLHALM